MQDNTYKFLQGGGEMGALIRAHDWSQTSLGNPDTWPQSLRTTIGIVLNTRFPMFMYWGPDLVCFYNDAYRPSLGVDGKHPTLLGQPAKIFWAEIWHILEPLIEQVLSGGGATWHEDQLVPFYRNGQIEDIYWTFSYSPVADETGEPAGIIVACTETTDKVLKLNNMRDSKEELEFAIDAAELGTWDLNPDTNKFIGNDRLKSWFGLPPEAEIELPLAISVIADKDRARVAEAIQTALLLSSGGKYDIEYTIIHPRTKKERIVRARGKALFNPQGVAIRLNGTLQDITEEVVARQNIEDAEERARLAADAAEVGTFDLNLENNDIITSPRFDIIFGLDTSSGHANYVSLLHPDDTEVRKRAYKKAILTGRLFYAVRIIWRNEEIRWIQAEGKVYYDADKRPVRLLGTIIDITESKTVKEELLQTNQRLEIALEAGRLGSYELQLETGTMYCTNQFKANYGVAADIWFKYPDVLEAILPAYREEVQNKYAVAIKDHSVYNAEYQVKWPDGSIHWINASGKARYDDNGHATHMVGVTFDVTEQKLLQQQKDEFIGIASHELKTPVTSIKAYTQVLERMLNEKGDVKEASMISKMDAQLNRLTSLIGDLLDVTKINSGRLQFNYSRFNFNELIKEVTEDLQRTTEKHTLIEDLQETGHVYADRDRISQVLVNFITNAIKYSPHTKEIIVSTQLNNNEVVVSVQDYGIGISKEKQQRVFEQFYRVSGSKQHTFPGLGLGLYISSEIIKREGGRIWVDSKEGKGSTFYFALPVQKLNI